jgi:hypothetical protein
MIACIFAGIALTATAFFGAARSVAISEFDPDYRGRDN